MAFAVRSLSTQCNFYINETVKYRDKQVQATMKVRCRSVTSQTTFKSCVLGDLGIEQLPYSKPIRQNVSTQCCLTAANDIPKRSVGLQVDFSTELSNKTNFSRSEPGVLLSVMDQLLPVLSQQEYRHLKYEICKPTYGERCLIISNQELFGLPGVGLDPVKLVITESGNCSVFVPFKPVKILNLALLGCLREHEYKEILNCVSGTGFVFCSGVTTNYGSKERNIDTSCLSASSSVFEHPHYRIQARCCPVWYKHDVGRFKKNKILQCKDCRKQSDCFAASRKRKLENTPNRKEKRMKVGSNYSIGKLTPRSQKVRLSSLRKARNVLTKKVQQLENKIRHRDLMLMEEQSSELEKIVSVLNTSHSEELEELFSESSNKSELKRIWERDSAKKHSEDSQMFFEDQLFCRSGSVGNRWSSITLRIALAIYCRSPSAYQALKSFNILQLPSIDTVQAKAQKFNSSPGINHSYLAEQKGKYDLFKRERQNLGLPVPVGEGSLIFDEVRVIEKVMWNSKNHSFLGFAMTPEEFPLLTDVLENSNEDLQPTKRILQFLWRDLSSEFDLLGPYFTFSDITESHVLIGCILETMSVLQSYSFQTNVLVSDGASENLRAIKMLLGIKGTIKPEESILPSFENPFLEQGRKVFWVICPSHELKSMVGALHSSRVKGTKSFSRKGVSFGWKQVEEVKERDDDRARNGQMRTVPRLLPSYIIRDSWTRLNVKPSKIMQQEEFLSELFAFSNSAEGINSSRESAYQCYMYLRALNQIFENGLLSSSKIDLCDCPPSEVNFKRNGIFQQLVKRSSD